MRGIANWRWAASLALLLATAPAAAEQALQLSHGRFEREPVLQPQGDPARVMFWFAGRGEEAARARRLRALRDDGALVIEVDTERLQARMRQENGRCGFGAGDVENFSRFVQAYLHIPSYRLPLLGGDGDGAALAYAVAAQAPPQLFAGLVTDGLPRQAELGTMICGKGVDAAGHVQPVPLPLAWLLPEDAPAGHGAAPAAAGRAALDAFVRQVPQARRYRLAHGGDALPGLLAAARTMAAQKGVSLPPPPASLAGLPIVEVPAAAGGSDRDTFAIFVSGDGGWAGLDKNVAGALAQAGIPVVGVDSLRYFWSARTPASFAADLDRIVRYYAPHWNRSRVLLIGFSQGADVLPAAYNQLPAATRQAVAMTALLSLASTADYEFHVSNWLHDDGVGLAIPPEVARMPAATTLCVYGVDDGDTVCPHLPAGQVQLVALPGDHHFKGDYDRLATAILQHLQASQAAPVPAPAK